MAKKKVNRKKRIDTWLNKNIRFILPLLLLVIIGGFLLLRQLVAHKEPAVSSGNEIAQILATEDLKTRVKLYRALIERVGPVQAQEDLLNSGLPFTGETHLLNHTVGDYIYEMHGLEGITMCRNYFLESCYHGLLLHVIGGDAAKDLQDIKTIMSHCDAAGPTVAVQCAHGIGHGYVAVSYANLDRGLKQCTILGEKIENFPVFNCLDGAFMENIWAVHEGEPSPDRWVKDGDDFYPCNDARLQLPGYAEACWSNQPSLLYQRYSADLSKVGSICQTVTPDRLRETCYNGLSRQIHPLTENKIDRVFSLCSQLSEEWHGYCRTTIVGAAFSVGDRKLPYDMCLKETGADKDNCYAMLIGSIRGSRTDTAEIRRLCTRIPETDQTPRLQCLDNL